jgi:hypothetical protein
MQGGDCTLDHAKSAEKQNLPQGQRSRLPSQFNSQQPFESFPSLDSGALTMTLKFETNPVFDNIKPVPNDQRRYVYLFGFIGKVDLDSIQVYPSLDLACYLQIPTDGIKAAEKADPVHEISPTRLLVDVSTTITVVNNRQRSVEAGFLAGAIAGANMPETHSSGVPGVSENGTGDIKRDLYLDDGVGSFSHNRSTPNCLAAGVCICAIADNMSSM